LQSQAWATLAATKGAPHRQMLAMLEQMGAEPFRLGDFRQPDQTGRSNEVALIGE